MSKSSKRKRSAAARTKSSHANAPKTITCPTGPPAETTSRASNVPALSRLEIGLVVLILACGVGLRIGFPSRMAVEHFDEGVYASNLWFDVASGGQYPARHLYAPPLEPAVIEASLLAEQVMRGPATRPTDVAAMIPNLLAGCLTLVIVWWMMRTWFGRTGALAAMTLTAGSEFHALYTRTALTDVMLLPWMLLAVFWFDRALVRRQLWLLVLAGLACGLAWWTKYNGWLPLLISLGAIVLRLALVRTAWRSIRPDLGYWCGFSLIAAAVWSPYLWSLQAYGGYAPVMANHRGYVVGLSGWPRSLTNQLQNLACFDGWTSCLAPAAAILVVLVTSSAGRRATAEKADDEHGGRLDVLLAGALAASSIALAAWCGLAVVLSYLGVAGLVATVRHQRSRAALDASGSHGLACWLVASWFAGLFVMTPLYSPYPRLALAWSCSSWLAGGLGLAALGRACFVNESAGPAPGFLRARGGRCLLVVVLLCSSLGTWAASQHVTQRGVPAWQDRAALRTVAEAIAAQIDVQTAIVFVQGEPGLFYQLRAAGVDAVPGVDLQAMPATLPRGVTAYLVTGLHADRSAEFQARLADAMPDLKQVGSFPHRPSDLVLLNNFRADELDEQRRANWRVRLYRWK